MAARDIERFNLDYTFDEIVFVWVKRGCFAFAGIAMSLGVLDLAGIHSVSTAGSFWRNSWTGIASIGEQIRSGDLVRSDGIVVRVQRVAAAPPRPASGPVEQIAAMRGHDALELALAPAAPALRQDLLPSKQTVVIAPVATDTKPGTPAAIPPQIATSAASGKTPELPKSADPRPALPVAIASPSQSALPQRLAPSPQAAGPSAIADAAPNFRLASIDPGQMPPATNAALPLPVIPLENVPLPSPSPPIPPPSPAMRLKLDDKEHAKALRCLANAIYFEARSEPVRGQMAVAQVVINRVFSNFYPNDVCSVVYQNAHRRLACQFTFACDGKSKAIHDRRSWTVANRIARQTLDGQIYLPEVGKSTHYHAVYVRPIWAREMRKLARHGLHTFYRPYAWGNGAELPAWGEAMAQAKKSVSH